MADNLLEKLSGAEKNISLKNYTTYKIGGPAKYFFVAKKEEDLISAFRIAKDLKLPVFILGGGSNILVSEKGFNGLVVKIDISNIELKKNIAVVGAGANITKLAYLTADNGLSGFEWAAGVPGTIGGSIYGNAQAFGTKISDTVKSVEAINLKTLKFCNFTKAQCKFSLKSSIFKENTKLVIVSAGLEFKEKTAKEIKDKIKEFLEYRRTKHPMEFPSAGSVFVNPVRKKLPKAIGDRLAGMVSNGVTPEKIEVIPAGYLIAKVGLVGKKIGNAQISEKHANFIINLGGAKAKDVLSLINLAKKKVKKVFGISLETEVQFVGF